MARCDWLASLKRSISPWHFSSRRQKLQSLNTGPLPLETRTLPSVLPISAEFQVNTYTTNFQFEPQIAMDADGDYVIVWESSFQDGSSGGVYAQRFAPSGKALGAEFRVNSTVASAQSSPSVAMDDAGNFVVAWTSGGGQDGNVYGIYAQRYNASGVAQGSEFRVNTYITGSQTKPDIAMDSDGDFVVVWNSYEQDGGLYGVYGQRFNSSGIAQGSEFRVNVATVGHQFLPTVDMDAQGNFVVAWASQSQDGDSLGIYSRRYSSTGVAAGTEFPVNTYTTSVQTSPSIALDRDGDFVISWTSYAQDSSGEGIYARRFTAAGVPQGIEFRVNGTTLGNQSDSDVNLDPDGNFVIVWSSASGDGSLDGIFAQRYANSGFPVGLEFQVNSYTTNWQQKPSVAIDADGDFVFTWDSYGQEGGNHDGIYAQRYQTSHAAYVGTWRAGSFFLDSNHSDNWEGSVDDTLISFGATTDKPISGDWNGDGYDDIGIWRNGVFYLDANGNGLWDGSSTDRQFTYGLSSDTPIVGDWNGDGVDDVGVWRAGRFILDLNGNRVLDSSPTDPSFTFGSATDTPIVGDWGGDGVDDIGVWRAGRFFLDLNANYRWDRPNIDTVFFFGTATDKPVIGDWNGDGVDDVGVWRSGQFWVDFNQNYHWDGPENEYIIDFGNSTDTPLIGYWRPKSILGTPPLPPSSAVVNATAPLNSSSPQSAATPLETLIAVPRKKTVG